jgi:putative ABC transport system permease protein
MSLHLTSATSAVPGLGGVPLARRALFQDRRRAGLATAGVAAALLLVLMLQGIFDGSINQVTTYLRNSPADVFVAEKNVRTMHMSVSTLDPTLPAEVARVPGVAWAEGIRYTTTFLIGSDQRQQLSYVIGYDTMSGRAGPQQLTSGRVPRSGEIAVERVAADRLRVGLGDSVELFGAPFVVSGLFTGGTTIVNSTAFITIDDFARFRGDSLAYVLAGADKGVDADELADRIGRALPEDTVQTRNQFVEQESALVRDMGADILQIMTLVGLAIALAVIGLTLFTLTLAKLREHAVVKALGGSNLKVARVVVAQAAWSVFAALAVATVTAVLLGVVIGRVNPAVEVSIEPQSVLRLGLSALLIGALGAVAPLRRVVTVDPASAFRGSS